MMSIAMFVTKRLIIAMSMGLAAFCTATPARAIGYAPPEAIALTYQGDTTNQPTWLRTIIGNPPDQVTGLLPGEVPIIVPYSLYQFAVAESGLYTFGSAVPGATSSINGDWDNFLVLYQNSFDPTDQLTNILVAGNAPNNGDSTFTRELTAGGNYFLVTTGRRGNDFGAFTNAIAFADDNISPPAISSFAYQGDTTGAPTSFHLVPGDPPRRVSNVSAAYSVFQFAVDYSGLYDFTSAVPNATSAIDGSWDNFLTLYQDSFNPTTQLTNALAAANAPNNGSLAFSKELTTGKNYFLVTSGRQLSEFGAFTNTINGAGKVTAVPERGLTPGTLAAVSIGLLLYKQRRGSISGRSTF